MTILHSCCCWRSVRHGSIASGVYTGIYCAVNAAHSSYLLHEELRFLKNGITSSLIDHDLTNGTSAVFSSLIFAFSSCGVITTILLFYGIYKDIKYLLVPWIFNMIFFTMVDIIYIINGLLVHALLWNPSVAILITVDFFLNALNLYAILCVISQYQEYKAGRGKAIDVEHMRASDHQFSTALTAAADLRKPPPSYFERSSPPRLQVPHQLGRPKKSVKFGNPPDMENVTVSPPLWEEVKNSPCRGVDTAPLIDTGGTKVEA